MEKVLMWNEGKLILIGVVFVLIGKYIGCFFKDKFIVKEVLVVDKIVWGVVN